MENRRIEIKGMTCSHCVKAVKKRLAQLPGVNVQDVQIGSATVSYDPDRLAPGEIDTAIEEEGYTVVR